jgi:hypothetical protein
MTVPPLAQLAERKVYTRKERRQLSIRNVGSRNPRAKQYMVTLPDGGQFITDDRRGFCEDHGLTYFSVCDATRNGRAYRGYRFKEVASVEV